MAAASNQRPAGVGGAPGNTINIRYNNVVGSNNWQSFVNANKGPAEIAQDSSLNNAQCRCVAMDCEMVGVGPDKRTNMLARVSIVNSLGDCLYDTFVKPTAPVTDYRTAVSGVRQSDLANAEKFGVVQSKVAQLIKDKILVGHAVHNDLMVLKLQHPKHFIRDTSRYKRFIEHAAGTPSLKRLTSHFLNVNIQDGEHNSIQDAQATMQLYMLYRREWEADVRKSRHFYYNNSNKQKKKPKPTYRPRRMHKNYHK